MLNKQDEHQTIKEVMELNKRRGYAFILSLLLIIALIAAGCSSTNNNNAGSASNNGGTTSNSSNSDSGSPTESIKLTMWGGVPPESGPQAVVDAWNAENANIQVEYIRFVNDDDGNLKLDTALMTGQNVDLYVGYDLTRLKKRVDAGVAVDLSEYNDYDIDAKIGSDAKLWMLDGKYYGIPTKKSVTFVALNKDMLEAAGLEVPTQWTWEELRQYAKALTKDGVYGFVQHTEVIANPMDTVLSKFGYTKADGTSNMDHPAIQQWMTTLNAMMHEDNSTPSYGEQITSKMPVENMFLNGEAAMLNIGEWLIRSSNNLKDFPRDFPIAFAPVPRSTDSEADHLANGGLGDIVSINPKSKHVDAAWEFLKWYTDGGMMPMAAGGRLPASSEVDAVAAMDSLLGDVGDTYDVDSLQYVLFGDQTPTYVRSLEQEVIDGRKAEYEQYFLGDQTIDQTITNIVKRHNQFLGK